MTTEIYKCSECGEAIDNPAKQDGKCDGCYLADMPVAEYLLTRRKVGWMDYWVLGCQLLQMLMMLAFIAWGIHYIWSQP